MFKKQPVCEGEEVVVDVVAKGAKGDGIAKVDGFVLVVPGAQVGDRVRVRVSKVTAKCGFAEQLI